VSVLRCADCGKPTVDGRTRRQKIDTDHAYGCKCGVCTEPLCGECYDKGWAKVREADEVAWEDENLPGGSPRSG
jgi:hypothetical protein